MIKQQIGEILLEQGTISQQQYDEAHEQHVQSGQRLEHILLQKNFVSDEDLAKAFAVQMSLPYLETINEKVATPQLLAQIPLKFLRQHAVLPIILDGQKTIVTSDPCDLEPIDNLTLLLKGDIAVALATRSTIVNGINKYYPLETSKEMIEELDEQEPDEFELSSIEEKDILEMANDAPIIKLVNHILFQAVKEDASDIHVEPFEKELRVRYRIDGIMHQKLLPPKRYQGAIVSRIKIMASLNIAEKRLPQDGRIEIKIADKPIDIRVSILPGNYGERIVMRLLVKDRQQFLLEKLGFSKRDYDLVIRMIKQPSGIILITGPTGSGKTSTLYAVLNHLNKPEVNIITVEDPVEYTISGVNQVQVNEQIGLTFATALRAILRQDPDIALIGEIRDQETAQIATQAALTGHLVLSTIHTNNAPSTITRLIDMEIEPFLIASTVTCIVAQRLVRRLCEKCKKAYTPTPAILDQLGISQQEAKKITFYQPGACPDCLETGYHGRLAIFEIMEISDEIRKLIITRSDASLIRKQALREGMLLLGADGLRRVKDGITTIEEVASVSYVEGKEL